MSKIIFSIVFLCFLLTGCVTAFVENKNVQVSEGYIDSTDGIPIFFTKQGNPNDTSLLFIHCLGCNSKYWEAQSKYFSRKYQIITLDLAGHGLSGTNRHSFTIEKYAEDVASVIRKLGLKKPILVGQSFGGAVAVATAVKLPGRIMGVISINAFGESAQIPKKDNIEDFLKPFNKNYYKAAYPMIKSRFAPYTDKAIIYQISKDIALAPPEIAVNSLRNYFYWMSDKYPIIRTKLSAPLFQMRSIKYSAEPAPPGNIIYIDSSGHYLPQEAPEKFNIALERILEQLIIPEH